MRTSVAYCLLIVVGGSLMTMSVMSPAYLSDANLFLKGFVTHELLGVLGVILAITLASAAQIHLTLNRIEEDYGQRKFVKTRANIKQASHWLIGLFAVAVILLVVKSNVPVGEVASAICNSLALLIIVGQILILIDITELIFAIPATIKDGENETTR